MNVVPKESDGSGKRRMFCSHATDANPSEGRGEINRQHRQKEIAEVPQRNKRKKNIYLFGLSADPPTGYGGHVGIVKALIEYIRDSNDNNDNANNSGKGGISNELNKGNDDTAEQRSKAPDHDEGDGRSSNLDDQTNEIWVLPVYRHTYANKRERLVSFDHRYRMCQLAFRENHLDGVKATGDIAVTSAKVVVSDAEFKSWRYAVQGKSEEESKQISVGTASLLDYLHRTSRRFCENTVANEQKDPNDDNGGDETDFEVEYTFCLGKDAFMDLTAGKWRESKRVMELLDGHFLVLDRKVKGASHEDMEGRDSNERSSSSLQERVRSMPNARLLSIDQLEDVSSSQVRACADIQQLQAMVVPEVLQYMKQHQLYQFSSPDP